MSGSETIICNQQISTALNIFCIKQLIYKCFRNLQILFKTDSIYMVDVAWLYLIAACILEPVWVVCLEKSDNFRRPGWAVVTIVAVLSCLYLLSLAVLSIGPGVAYSILAGIGAIGTVVAGVVLYKEPIHAKKIFFIIVIVIGIVGIRLASGGV